MFSPVSRRVLFFGFALLVLPSVAPAQPLNWLWWKMEPSLALTPEQSDEIDAIFQEGIARLQQEAGELDGQERKLSGLIANMAEEAQVVRQIDRVETIRSSLNKTRTLMLYRMRQVLTPEQRMRLNALRDRREQERRQRERQRVSPDGEQSAVPRGRAN